VFGPVVARPAAAALGAPLPMLRRMTGKLARENAMRNPRRTSSTASALMVGVGVVTLFTVLAASVKVAIDDVVSSEFRGDLVIETDSFSGAGLSPQLAHDLAALPEIDIATGLGIGTMTIDGDVADVTIIEPAEFDPLLDIDVTQGSLSSMTDDQIAVSEGALDEYGWELGDEVTGTFATDNASETFTIATAYDSTQLVDDFLVPTAAWTAHAAQPFDIVVMMRLADGVSMADGRAAVQPVTDRYFAPDVQDRDEYVDSVAAEIDAFLTIVYVLLLLAIVIALMGIANTLSLSVHERTRELGLLRAVGQSRRQLRSMVRWESVIIALFGTIGGILVGLFLGWGLLEVIGSAEGIPTTYTVPFGQVLTVLLVGAAVGVIAGWRPARRASKLDILDAVAAE